MMINAEPSPVRERFDQGMSVEEFIRRYDEQPFELIEGDAIPLAARLFAEDSAISQLLEFLFAFNAARETVTIYPHATYVLINRYLSRWVEGSREPDISVYRNDRLNAWIERKDNTSLLTLNPDLAIEVISPTDDLTDMWLKSSIYLQDGVRLIWIINPATKELTIFAQNKAPITLTENGSATGGDVLPGFTVAVKNLFISPA